MVQNWFRKDEPGKNILTAKTTDHRISEFIYKKTKVKIDHVYIAPSNALFAFCGGFTKKPMLVISKGAYESFRGDAREWLLLHEIGHHVLDHTFGIITVELSYAIIGCFVLYFIHQLIWFILFSLLLSLLFGIISIQTNKIFDIYANNFAVTRMKNPLGMKEGALLFMKQARENGMTHDTILMKLFYPWNYAMWRRTIKDAEKAVKNKKDR